jgi:hypothetical protein
LHVIAPARPVARGGRQRQESLRRLGPAEGEFDDGAWRGGILERLQGRAQDGALGVGVTGLAERPSEGELDGGHPWRADRRRQIENHRQRDGADARGLNEFQAR